MQTDDVNCTLSIKRIGYVSCAIDYFDFVEFFSSSFDMYILFFNDFFTYLVRILHVKADKFLLNWKIK